MDDLRPATGRVGTVNYQVRQQRERSPLRREALVEEDVLAVPDSILRGIVVRAAVISKYCGIVNSETTEARRDAPPATTEEAVGVG